MCLDRSVVAPDRSQKAVIVDSPATRAEAAVPPDGWADAPPLLPLDCLTGFSNHNLWPRFFEDPNGDFKDVSPPIEGVSGA